MRFSHPLAKLAKCYIIVADDGAVDIGPADLEDTRHFEHFVPN